MNITTYQSISTMNKKGVFWHGMSAERAIEALNAGSISPHSVQRFWQDGKTYLDNNPLYDTCFWLNGWSMSRDLQVSKKFGMRGVIFAFSKNVVKSRFKTIPYSWGGSIPNASNETRKKEREEFILSGSGVEQEKFYEEKQIEIREKIKLLSKNKSVSVKEKKQIHSLMLEELKKYDFGTEFFKPHGKKLPLNMSFGFFISNKKPEDKICEVLEQSSLFLGYI